MIRLWCLEGEKIYLDYFLLYQLNFLHTASREGLG